MIKFIKTHIIHCKEKLINMIYHDLIVVGGGASGLMAAVVAKDFGLDVAIVEGTDRIGKKILVTGNGRCNISNKNITYPYKNFHSDNNNFFQDALSKFSVEDTENMFLSLGLPFSNSVNGKLYPKSLQASSVIDIFRMAIDDKNIPLYNNCQINSITKRKTSFYLAITLNIIIFLAINLF